MTHGPVTYVLPDLPWDILIGPILHDAPQGQLSRSTPSRCVRWSSEDWQRLDERIWCCGWSRQEAGGDDGSDTRDKHQQEVIPMDDVTRLQEIQETIADERERLERGDDGRLESRALSTLMDEAVRLQTTIDATSLQLTEAQWEEAAKRRDFAAYEYSRIKDNTELLGKIHALREKGDVVGLYCLTSQMPAGPMRAMAERPLIDTRETITELRKHAVRIRDLQQQDPEKRRERWEMRQQRQQQSTMDDLIERKKQQINMHGGF